MRRTLVPWVVRCRRRTACLGAAVILAGALALPACGSDGATPTSTAATATAAPARGAVRVVTTVSPLRNLVENVGGDRLQVTGLVPEGVNSHTFAPPPSAARALAEADLVVVNGLHLETPALAMAEANVRDGVEIVLLGESTVTPDEYVYDFSFPRDAGNPNPHLWTSPPLARRYAELIRDALIRVDPDATAYYRANFDRLAARIDALDAATLAAAATVPAAQRKLLTYHDSFPYFAPHYGFEVIGAIQPSDFSDPSPQEVARLVEQIRESGVPAIFGSEVFPSAVLDTIAREAGAVQVSTLRDDDLPGDPGDTANSYVGMMVEDVRTIVTALGGDASALDGLDVTNTWIPFKEFTAE